MEGIKPRFEFRTWAKNFGKVEEKLYALSKCEMIRESKEIYIISARNSENNTKIREIPISAQSGICVVCFIFVKLVILGWIQIGILQI